VTPASVQAGVRRRVAAAAVAALALGLVAPVLPPGGPAARAEEGEARASQGGGGGGTRRLPRPWRPRRIRGQRPNYQANAWVDPEDWPPEPPSPDPVDPERLAAAFRTLCGSVRPRTARLYGRWLAEYAETFDIDPFLLGGLAYRRSHCIRDAEGPQGELGMTGIERRMYAERLRRGVYRYRVLGPGDRWVERTIDVGRWPFAGPRLELAQSNLYFAAAFLRAWREQHPGLDRAFDQVPHRHHVSHFVWGDRVRSDRDEDRILTDRRRLLRYYGALPARRTVTRLGVRFGAPLDGEPRVVQSGLGDERDDGDRAHRGVDLESEPGEPVRAVADGMVYFAGIDLPPPAGSRQMPDGGYEAIPDRRLGAGGRYVCLRHRRDGQDSLRSCYMHLEEVRVAYGDEVSRGDLLGTVGRTGMRRSAAHLHLELHGPEGLLDPRRLLHPLLIGDPNAEPDYPDPN